MQPSASVTEVREALRKSVDRNHELDQRTTTGGRLNVSKAVDVFDHTPPAAPSLRGTTPPSRSNYNHPRIVGSAEEFSIIQIFDTASCSGQAAGVGSGRRIVLARDRDDSFRRLHEPLLGEGYRHRRQRLRMLELGRIRRADPRVPGPQAARQAIPQRQEGPQGRGLQTGKGAAAEAEEDRREPARRRLDEAPGRLAPAGRHRRHAPRLEAGDPPPAFTYLPNRSESLDGSASTARFDRAARVALKYPWTIALPSLLTACYWAPLHSRRAGGREPELAATVKHSKPAATQVGIGFFSANVLLREQSPFPSRGKILAFNGEVLGHPVIFGHIYGT